MALGPVGVTRSLITASVVGPLQPTGGGTVDAPALPPSPSALPLALALRTMSTSSVGSVRGTVTRTGRLNERGSPTVPDATAYAMVSAEATTKRRSSGALGSGSQVRSDTPPAGGG